MSLSSKTELARALFRTPPSESVTRISGTATADSSDGTVTVQLEDGDVIEVGTIGSVSSGDTVTIHVQRGEAQVIASEGWGDAMQAAVDEAQAIAEATGQHFWHDSNGAHVTEVTADQWAQSQTGHNILVNSLGILLRKALNYIAAWTGSALSFYDGNGNAAANVTASFGSAGAQIGKVDESHLEMDYHSMRLIDKDGDLYFKVEDMRDATGKATIVQTFPSGSAYYVLAYQATDTDYTVTVSDSSGGTVTKYTDHIEFSSPTSGTVTATYDSDSDNLKALTFGTRSGTTGGLSFACGDSVEAAGFASHAEGDSTEASGFASHAEGYMTTASGDGAHAEGSGTNALGPYSHAQNLGTVTIEDEPQTAIGKYNVKTMDKALIIGNGTADNARSNALTVDWSGNVEAAGDVSGATLSSAGGLSLYGGTALEDCFVTDEVTATIGSIAAGAAKWVNVATAKTGYAALAMVGYYLNGANMLVPYCARLNGTNAQFALRNSASSASSATATIVAQVLYVKTA